MSWTKHIQERHKIWADELEKLGIHGQPGGSRDLHVWLHEEFQAQLDHRHDEHGQLIELETP